MTTNNYDSNDVAKMSVPSYSGRGYRPSEAAELVLEKVRTIKMLANQDIAMKKEFCC